MKNYSGIDLESDFITFRDQIINKFGEQYYIQSELFFTRAVELAKKGLFNSAIQDGNFALDLVNFANDKDVSIYIIGFLSQLHCDMGKIGKAKAYYELGMKLIDINNEKDMQLFKDLKELIDSESWKENDDTTTDE